MNIRKSLALDDVLFQIRLPKQGSVLELIGKRSIPFTESKSGGLVGINRAKRQVVFAPSRTPSP